MSGTITLSPTITQTFEPNAVVNLTIFNAAGEKVATLLSLTGLYGPDLPFDVLTPTFAPRNGATASFRVGPMVVAWNGTNDGGQTVDNGVYYVKMETRDPFGSVTTNTKEVVVLSAPRLWMVRIFNSAGELVRTLHSERDYSGPAPSRLRAMDGTTLVSGGEGAALKLDLGSTTLAWDGKNEAGQLVQSGQYQIQLVETTDGGQATLETLAVTVVRRAAKTLISDVSATPNPWMAGQAAGALVVRFTTPPRTQVLGRVYTLDGQLVATLDNHAGEPVLAIDVVGLRMATGVYLVALWARAPWGEVERVTVKIAVIR
jgi:hypothetical protein